MTTLNSNFFEYPLIGSIGDFAVERRIDRINPTEMLNYMFKKQFGIVNIGPYTNYASEPPTVTTSINNSPLEKQYSQEIPKQPPVDLINDNTFNINNIYNSDSRRYISISKPYMAYYSNIDMVSLSDESFHAGFYNADTGNRFFLTQNAISPFYGEDPNIPINNKYYGKLIVDGRNISNSSITIEAYYDPLTGEFVPESQEIIPIVIGYSNLAFGQINSGDWLLDCDTGILTFYDNVPASIATVNRRHPPRISFWRYEGLIGNNTIMKVVEF